MHSKASLLGHPVHPLFVVYPIAFFVLAFISDVVYELGWAGKDYPQFSYILIIGGIATALAAAIPGFIDYMNIRSEGTKRTASSHMAFNLLVLVLESISLAYRAHGTGHYWKNGWILSLVSVALLIVSGWLGQEMVYVHKMGIDERRSEILPGERRSLT